MGNLGPTFGIAAVMAFVLLIVSLIVYLAGRYKRCPSDKILVIFGRVGAGSSSRTMHGGGALILPLIQDYAYLSLTPITIGIPLENALSLQNIRIHVPSTFTVGISTSPEVTRNAAERLLHLNQTSIEEMAQEIIFGQLRLTVASLTIEQINQDRESFLELIRQNVEPELNKIGLHLINVNITDITDESNYIDSIGKKAASEAINTAKVDVAEQTRMGEIGAANEDRQKDIGVAEARADAEKGRKKAEAGKRIYVQGQEAEAVEGENTAKANIAAYNATLEVQQAAAFQKAEVAKFEAEVAVQKAQYKAEFERLRANEIAREETDKQKVEIAAEAQAQQIRRIAKGEADGVLLKFEAEAAGLQKLLEAKAKGYQELVDSVDGDTKAAATLLMIEKLEEIVAKQTEAISNLKIDKITVWDSGGGNGESSSTANFVSNLFKSLPPLQDISSMAGLELPEFLGKVAKDKPQEIVVKTVVKETDSDDLEKDNPEIKE
jgi:flotillin